MSINERLESSLIDHSSPDSEFPQKLTWALKISRETDRQQNGLLRGIRQIIQEPALFATLGSMRLAQMFGRDSLVQAPVNMELASSEGNPYWKSPASRAEFGRHALSLGTMLSCDTVAEVLTFKGGEFFATINPLSEVDTSLAVIGTLASYGWWIWGIRTNARQALGSLEETGVAVSWTAKAAHDLAKKMELSPRMQRVATYLGFSFFDITGELPYLALTLALEINSSDHNVGLAFLMGADMAAGGLHFLEAYGAKEVLRAFKSRRDIRDIFRRLP